MSSVQDRRAVASGGRVYTREQRARRDATPWTLVQGLLAPLQFVVFLASVALVVRFIVTGEGLAAATASIVAKTLVLYVIMVTGAIWEREVFGQYLLAPAFFWEDVVSFGVIALHTTYLAMVAAGVGAPIEQITVALAGYAAYCVNATQFLVKMRRARREAGAGPP
jgi:3-vinyl bacteriochlorophyllide hydratase